MSRRNQNAIFLRDGLCKCNDCEQLDDSFLRQTYNVERELDGKRCKCKKVFLATCCYNSSKVCSNCHKLEGLKSKDEEKAIEVPKVKGRNSKLVKNLQSASKFIQLEAGDYHPPHLKEFIKPVDLEEDLNYPVSTVGEDFKARIGTANVDLLSSIQPEDWRVFEEDIVNNTQVPSVHADTDNLNYEVDISPTQEYAASAASVAEDQLTVTRCSCSRCILLSDNSNPADIPCPECKIGFVNKRCSLDFSFMCSSCPRSEQCNCSLCIDESPRLAKRKNGVCRSCEIQPISLLCAMRNANCPACLSNTSGVKDSSTIPEYVLNSTKTTTVTSKSQLNFNQYFSGKSTVSKKGSIKKATPTVTEAATTKSTATLKVPVKRKSLITATQTTNIASDGVPPPQMDKDVEGDKKQSLDCFLVEDDDYIYGDSSNHSVDEELPEVS